MTRRALQIEGFTSEELAAALRKDEKFSQAIRLYACYLVSLGKRPHEIEQLYNTSFKSICNWVHRLNQGGIDALRDKPKPGRTPRLNPEQKQELWQLIAHGSPQDHGYNSALWTGPMLIAWIEKKWEVTFKKAQIYNLIHALGFSYQKAKGIYAESAQREEKIEELKKTSAGRAAAGSCGLPG